MIPEIIWKFQKGILQDTIFEVLAPLCIILEKAEVGLYLMHTNTLSND